MHIKNIDIDAYLDYSKIFAKLNTYKGKEYNFKLYMSETRLKKVFKENIRTSNEIENIRKMFEKEFSEAEMVCIPLHIFEDRDTCILEWSDPKGLQGCGFFKIKDNLIIDQRGYWDKLSFINQGDEK